MQKYYILDTCVDIKPQDKNYPKYFFDDLLSNGNVVLVFGGTKATNEVKLKHNLRDLLNNMKVTNQVLTVTDSEVDAAEVSLSKRIQEVIGEAPRECDDLHVFALAQISGCLQVISRDNRMAVCRDKIRNKVGHRFCPSIVVIQNEAAYKRTK